MTKAQQHTEDINRLKIIHAKTPTEKRPKATRISCSGCGRPWHGLTACR